MRLPELHRIRVKHQGAWVTDVFTRDPERAASLWEQHSWRVRSGAVVGHASWSQNGFIRQWVQTPEWQG